MGGRRDGRPRRPKVTDGWLKGYRLNFSKKGCNGSCKVKNHATLNRKIANWVLLAAIQDDML
jgi:hypothetical protein